MAAGRHANTIDPAARAMQPLHNLQWTLLNDPLVNKVCKYHTHPLGNICLFGRGCKFAHLQELQRPPLCEQLSSMHTLLSTLLSLLLPPSAPTAAAASVSTHTLNANAQPFFPDLFLPFETTLVATVTTDDLAYDFLDDTVDIDDTVLGANSQCNQTAVFDEKEADDARDVNGADSQRNQTATADEKQADDGRDVNGADYDRSPAAHPTAHPTTHSASDTEQLWRWVLGNNPQQLLAKYPMLLEEYQQQRHLGHLDAYLCGLKKRPELNSHPVIVKGYVQGKQRFKTEIHYHSETPEMLLIKNENLNLVCTRPYSDAFTFFKSTFDDDDPELWPEFMAHEEGPYSDVLLRLFVSLQMPFHTGACRRKFKQTYAEKAGYYQLEDDTVKYAKELGLGVTPQDCGMILSILYALSHHRQLHVMRLYEIPGTWTPQNLDSNILVLLPRK